MAVWGYVRVSSKDQNEASQVAEIRPLVTTESHLIVEKASGKDFNRPKYQALKNLIRPGDTLVIKALDRLGRNYEMIKEEWQWFKENHIYIRVLTMPILNTENNDNDLTNNLISDIVLQLLSYVAETERKNIKRRQADGIAVAHANGVKFGRPCATKPENWDEVIDLWEKGEITGVEAIKRTGLKRSTFYKLYKLSK